MQRDQIIAVTRSSQRSCWRVNRTLGSLFTIYTRPIATARPTVRLCLEAEFHALTKSTCRRHQQSSRCVNAVNSKLITASIVYTDIRYAADIQSPYRRRKSAVRQLVNINFIYDKNIFVEMS